MKTRILCCVAALSLWTSSALAADASIPAPTSRPVDLALCLDTSGSMSGLIDSARQKLWAIVNDLALARPAPRLRVALLTYGNDGHDQGRGWVKVETPFTDDLDLVSERLFAQTTNGGTELVGRVLKAALDELQWTASKQSLKLIFVAGNESADQDKEVNFRDVCRQAISRDIMVNSIYCGPAADEIAPGWKEVSLLADGHFASIDQNSGSIHIDSPFDAELSALGTKVNETYIPFGAKGVWGSSNQIIQDRNAAESNSSTVAARAVTKGGALYSCSSWDLVDACKSVEFKLEDIPAKDLPENMRKMTIEEKKAHIAKLKKQRDGLQKKIQDLSKKRNEYVAGEMNKHTDKGEQAFDNAVRKAVRSQAALRGFEFEGGVDVGPSSGVGTSEEEAPPTADQDSATAAQD